MRVTLCFLLLLPAAAQADWLYGVRWDSPAQIEKLERFGLIIRYIDSDRMFVGSEKPSEEVINAAGLHSFVADRATPGDQYFFADHLERPVHDAVTVVHEVEGDVALLRIREVDLPAVQVSQHFLWPLPKSYDTQGWLRSPGPFTASKQTARLSGDEMDALLEQVDALRLRGHVESLALFDPAQGSVPGNIRTRYARHPQTFESTEYIRDQLSDALGENAVEVQQFRRTEDDSVMYNVVGTLQGADQAAGYYVICAHYDAIALRSAGWDWEEDPAPGADDNATGVALVMESARLLAQKQLPWSVRFIAFSGEELGLWGSGAYVARALKDGDKIFGVLNFDMIGYNDLSRRLELVTNPPSRWLVELLLDANQRYDVGLRVDVLDDDTARLSDHAPFWVRGFDAILGIENYLPTDPSTEGVVQGFYRVNSQYHSVVDVPDSINWELVRQTTQLTIATLAQYATSEGLPNLIVYPGDLDADSSDNLRARIGNVGRGPLPAGYRVRISHCRTDSTECGVIYDQVQAKPLDAGGVAEVILKWDRYGEMVFLLEADPNDEIRESDEEDNSAYQKVRLVPGNEIVLTPNPYRPTVDGLLSFIGVPRNGWVRIFRGGTEIWSAQEDEIDQRLKFGAKINEILWDGVDGDGSPIEEGEYSYEVSTSADDLVQQGTILLQQAVRVRIHPSPFRPGGDGLIFEGIPIQGDVSIFNLTGELVWRAQEGLGQQASYPDSEIRWAGVNLSGESVGAGVYFYAIRGSAGAFVGKGKIAVVK